MNVFGKTVALVTGVALLGAIGFGAWFAYKGVVALFAGLDPQVATVTGIGCLVVLIAAWWIVRSQREAVRQGKALASREERAATYQLFVDFWEHLLRQGSARMDQLPVDLSEKLQLLERLLALYGGAAVVKEHTALRRLAQDKGPQHPDVRARLAEAVVAIRKDLGADTPYNIAQELQRLLLPSLATSGGTVQAEDARIRTPIAVNP